MAEAKKTARSKRVDELAQQFPATRYVPVRINIAPDGEKPTWEQAEVQVDEFEIPQLAQVAKIMAGIIDSVDESASPNILLLAAEHHEELIEAVAIAIGESPNRVRKFGSSSFIEVAFAIYEVNRDFFVRSLGSRASGGMAMLTRLMTTMNSVTPNGAGSTQSPSFASTAASQTPSA